MVIIQTPMLQYNKNERKIMLIKSSPLVILKFTSSLATLLLFGFLITACDNNAKTNKKSFSVKQKTQKFTTEATLKGKVSNKKEVFNSGEIKVTNDKGKIIATTQLQNGNHYSVKIPAGTELPLILSFFPDSSNSNKDKLVSVALYPTIKKYDINELTTLIAKTAKSLGGYTHTNMVMAADRTVGVPDANKTSTGFRGDPTKQYGGWH